MNYMLERLYGASPIWIQNLVLNAYGWKIRRERFNRAYEEWQRVFAENEHGSKADLAAMQDEAVGDLVQHAYKTVPYYREVMSESGLKPPDVRSVKDLPKLPILTKDHLRSSFSNLISSTYRRQDLKEGNSSGTTGSPVSVLWDRRVDVANNAVHFRARRWAGIEFGSPYASALGRTIVPITQVRSPFWRFNVPWKQLLLASFHLQEANLPSYLDAMSAYGVRYLEAYPSTAYVLARFLTETGRTLPLDAVITSSETLLDIQRATIEQAFACEVFDVFGQAERVLFASECERHDGLHMRPEYGAFEVVDERGEPVSPGGHGRIIGTGFQNYGMPLIRYDLGDVSALVLDPCTCGRALPRMARVTTKAEDIVITPEGRFVSSSTLTHPFKPLSNIRKSQIVQETPDRVTVKIVRRPAYTDADTARLVAALGERLGPSVTIEVAFVDDIPRGPSGKFRWVISKVPLRFGASAGANLYDESPPRTR
jgi:phenylacetate-CoA ligase